MSTASLVSGIAEPRPELSRRSRWLLAAAHVPLLLLPAVLAVLLAEPSGRLDQTSTVVLAVGAATAVCALQLRHGLAAARGARPRGWPVTLLVLAVLAYLPLLWLPPSWSVAQWALVASLVMLLPRRVGLPLGVLIVASDVVFSVRDIQEYALGPAAATWAAVYNLAVAAFGPAVLVAATLLVRVLDDLSAAHAELAEAAVEQERLRISRDLHDVLGQSLSAVSLKGELAMRLLGGRDGRGDRAAAMAEVESLTGVARAALRALSAVTFDRHPTSVPGELDAAARLLRAAGIRTRIDVALPRVAAGGAGRTQPRVQDDALGWVLREGVTNLLRHSCATEVTIRGGRRDGRLELEIVNNGAQSNGAPGSGLAGLAARLEPLGGVLSARPLPGERFRLAVDLPEELP